MTTYPHRPLPMHTMSEAEQLQASRQFLQRMRTRRTVRDFDPRPVPLS